jgi:DNA-directed RNA polymerase subunit beta
MAKSFTGRKRIRKSFGRIPEVAPMPNLIEVQRSSYDTFLQMDILPEKREILGLEEVFRSVFPIRDFSERAQLEFVRYELEGPKFDVSSGTSTRKPGRARSGTSRSRTSTWATCRS